MLIDAIKAQLKALATENESGQALVEFVIVFPVQLLLTLAIIQLALIMNAYIVVQHAAFMGARAVAVSDVEGAKAKDQAAKRVAARYCAAIASGESSGGGGGGDQLRWEASSGNIGFSNAKQQEAYGYATVKANDEANQGYVSCNLTYDYVLWIPVANTLFATVAGNRAASNARGRKVFRMQRVGFVATPWTMAPK